MEKLTNGVLIDEWGIEIHDPLPIDVYIVEIGFIEKIEYTTGKHYINRIPCIVRIFENLFKAQDYVREMKNKIVGKRYMLMYVWFEDGTKEYTHRSYGSLAYKDSRY